MDILFKSNKYRELCHDDALATRTFGRASARKLRTRLDDLAAASNLSLVRKLPGRFHPLKGELDGAFALDLQGGHRLVIEPAENPAPKLNDGTLDLSKVTAIRVIYIGNYHD